MDWIFRIYGKIDVKQIWNGFSSWSIASLLLFCNPNWVYILAWNSRNVRHFGCTRQKTQYFIQSPTKWLPKLWICITGRCCCYNFPNFVYPGATCYKEWQSAWSSEFFCWTTFLQYGFWSRDRFKFIYQITWLCENWQFQFVKVTVLKVCRCNVAFICKFKCNFVFHVYIQEII